MDALIHAMKYERRLEIATALGVELADATVEAPRPDAWLPVPLSRSRLRERGFNQSLEIAKALSQGGSVLDSRRTRETAPQASLPWKERARNIRGAFACSTDLNERHVALVDDVMTTGATLNELARIIKEAGAKEVSCWVVARTLREG